MSVYVMVRVELTGASIADINALVKPTKPHDGVNQLVDLLSKCVQGHGAIIDVAMRETTQAVTAQGSGTSATYTLA